MTKRKYFLGGKDLMGKVNCQHEDIICEYKGNGKSLCKSKGHPAGETSADRCHTEQMGRKNIKVSMSIRENIERRVDTKPADKISHTPYDISFIELTEDLLEEFERNHPYLARKLQNKLWENYGVGK